MKKTIKILFFGLCIHFSPVNGDEIPVQQRIQELVENFARREAAGGVAVAVIDGEGFDRRKFYVAGHTRGENSPAPNEKTTFYLASVTKLFTATLLAKFVKEGKVGLNDNAQKYVPDWVHVPKYDGTPVTLEELATHTSGFQRDPGGIKRPMHYEVNEFYNFLNHARLMYKPGTRNVYSNLGFGFLGLILANVAHKNYEQLVVQNICRPLGMPNTRVNFTQAMKDNKPQFFDRRGKLVKVPGSPTTPALEGNGAIASTIEDMSEFLAYNMGLVDSDLNDLLPMLQEHRFTLSPDHYQCLAWYHSPLYEDSSLMYFNKNGVLDGISTFIGFVQESKTGVVVLANCSSATVALGVEILKILNRP